MPSQLCSLSRRLNCHKHNISAHELALPEKSRCRFTLGRGRQEGKSYSCVCMIGVIRHRREQMNVLSWMAKSLREMEMRKSAGADGEQHPPLPRTAAVDCRHPPTCARLPPHCPMRALGPTPTCAYSFCLLFLRVSRYFSRMPSKTPNYPQGPSKNHLPALQTRRRAQNSGNLMRPSIFPKGESGKPPVRQPIIPPCPAYLPRT